MGRLKRRLKLRWMLAGLAVLLAGVAFMAIVPWPRWGRVSLENFALLRVGMSKPEVYEALGLPGDYVTHDTDWADDANWRDLGQTPDRRSHAEGVEVWLGDQAKIWVQFDTENHVSGATCAPLRPVDHGRLGNFLWRAKYRLYSWFP